MGVAKGGKSYFTSSLLSRSFSWLNSEASRQGSPRELVPRGWLP